MLIPMLIIVPGCIYYGRKLYGNWGAVIGLVFIAPLVFMLIGPFVSIPFAIALRYADRFLVDWGMYISVEAQMTISMSIAALMCMSVLRWYALEDERAEAKPQPQPTEPKPYQPETPPSQRPMTLDEQIDALKTKHDELQEKDDGGHRKT